MNAPTPEQRAIVEEAPGASLLVSADPGTGKTFTLIARSMHLAETLPGTVLVLSFTRAVVQELRRRAAEVGGARLDPVTIDGYAGRVLRGAGRELGTSFDRTVEAAVDLVREDPTLVARSDHVLVDEVQDLVGPRLDLVLEVLRHSDGGFTVFGDPRQAIYDWTGSGRDVFTEIREAFEGVLEQRLTRIHRPRVAGLLEGGARSSEELLQEARVVGTIRQAGLLLGRSRSILLTRTNGEALALADLLAADGCNALVRQGADARMAPGWIASFVNDGPRTSWARRHVDGIAERLPEAPPPSEAWRVLRRVAKRDDGVSAERLRLAVASPTRHDDFAFDDDGMISTVHRAKGLEWEHVVVLESPVGEEPGPQEDRVRFVAATRARKELWRLRRPDLGGRLRRGTDGRWERRSWQGRIWALELRIGDVAVDRPWSGAEDSAEEVQAALRALSRGIPVELRWHPSIERYVVLSGRRSIGCTTDDFVRAVKARWRGAPDVLAGGRLLAVRSAAGDPATSAASGLPGTGLWLTPEIVGFVGPVREEQIDD